MSGLRLLQFLSYYRKINRGAKINVGVKIEYSYRGNLSDIELKKMFNKPFYIFSGLSCHYFYQLDSLKFF